MENKKTYIKKFLKRITSYSEQLLKNKNINSFLHSKKTVYKKPLTEKEQFNIKFTEKQLNYLCQYQPLPRIFIEKNGNKFTEEQLNSICKYQNLSEKFINEHFDKFTEHQFDLICRHQVFSDEFYNLINFT